MTWRCARVAPVTDGWLVSAYAGNGILGADVPRDVGPDGLGLIAPYLTADDDGREVRIFVDNPPTTLTSFFVGEDGRVTATGPDGIHTGSGVLEVDGEPRGIVPIEIVIGASSLVAPGDIYRAPAEGRIWRAR